MKLKDLIESNNTGLDAIKRAPIVDYDTGVRCLRIGDISNNRPFNEWGYTEVEDNNYNKFQLKTGDIIVARTGATIGVNKYIDKDYKSVYNNGLIRIRVKKENNPKYVYYLLQSTNYKNFIKTISMGTSTQPNMQMNDLLNLKVPDFDKSKQDKIVEILGKIDDKIELNNEINNNLHELEKNLYKEYFKDLSDDNTKKLGELCNIKYGKGLPTTKIEKEGYPVYGGNGIIGYYHEFIYDNSQVLISCRGAASGNVIVSKPKSFVTNNSLILECDRKYHYYLKQYSLDNYYYEYTTGSAQPQITIDNIKDIVLSIPSDELLESFNKQMENLELKYFSNLEEISKLEQLRDTLLPKLMNGEIDLDSIEI